MEDALFVTPSGAARIAEKLLHKAHVKSVTMRRKFRQGEMIGYLVQYRTETQHMTLTEDEVEKI